MARQGFYKQRATGGAVRCLFFINHYVTSGYVVIWWRLGAYWGVFIAKIPDSNLILEVCSDLPIPGSLADLQSRVYDLGKVKVKSIESAGDKSENA